MEAKHLIMTGTPLKLLILNQNRNISGGQANSLGYSNNSSRLGNPRVKNLKSLKLDYDSPSETGGMLVNNDGYKQP